MLPYEKYLKQPARDLRGRMTEAESALWEKVRKKQIQGVQFYRQKPLGRFIVDFYCAAARLVVEVDGGQHLTKSGVVSDAERDAYLEGLDLLVLRFSNREVLENRSGVLEILACAVKERTQIPPAPL